MDESAIIEPADKWQRLAPISILYFIASGIKHAANNLIYTLPAFAVSYSSIKNNPEIWLPAVLGTIGLIALVSFLHYFFYTFRLANDTVEIRSGVFSKKHIDLPFTRIQNVTLEQPIYYRPFGYTCMQLDTAGSAKQEAKIVALPLAVAEELKTFILEKVESSIDESTSEQISSDKKEVIINTRSIGDLIIHGITNNRVWIILGVLAPLYDEVIEFAMPVLESVGIDFKAWFDADTHTIWMLGLTALALTFFAMMCIALLSIFGSILIFYDFTLSKSEGKYIRRSGLLTKQEINMRLTRLQMVVSKQDWLDVLLKRINLELRQNSSGVRYANDLSMMSNKIIVPSVKPHECQKIIEDAFPTSNLSQIEYQAISKRFIWRQIILWLMPLTLLFTGIHLANGQATSVSMLGLLAVPLVLGLIYCRWKRWGFAKDQHYFYVRKGLLGVDYYCFPIHKVQQTAFKQSLMMKRNHLGSVQFILASGGVEVPFMPEASAMNMIDSALFEVESKKKSWM